MSEKVFDFHYDAGHGWLKVPAIELNKLNIADKISKFSYRAGSNVYLEEDCDAPRFMGAYKTHYRRDVEFKEVNDGNNSPIRNYSGYFANRP